MRKISIPGLDEVDFFISSDKAEDQRISEGGILHSRESIEAFLRAGYEKMVLDNPEVKEIFSLYGKLNGLQGEAFLDAHGDSTRQWWVYKNGKSERHVQGWIDRNDGKYSALIIAVCNPGEFKPVSRKSLLFYGLGDIIARRRQIWKPRRFTLELAFPGRGTFSDYTLDSLLADLKKESIKHIE